ncbi:MAG: helix-turn-helix domain-containing protein [Sphingomonadaceae bacterium]|nr:helix-turn-helix domain-containing protein [Sphingomonadaceae bacterium]
MPEIQPANVAVMVRFHAPPPALQACVTTFYLTEIHAPEGEVVTDALQPEWANLRFFSGERPCAWIDGGDQVDNARFVATGPSIRATNFRLGPTRFWGIGLLPLGWARFIGLTAAEHANLIADGHRHASFARFLSLADSLFSPGENEAAELARIIAFFEAIPPIEPEEETRILAIHAALVDPEVSTVAEMVERIGTSQRTIERACLRHFGFSPKLLLRRQRFMRSLAQFMLDRSLKWIGAIDQHYHDQAQFVRDFREFMGMSPRQYAALPHPVLERFMYERARVHGAAVQTLDIPAGATSRPV